MEIPANDHSSTWTTHNTVRPSQCYHSPRPSQPISSNSRGTPRGPRPEDTTRGPFQRTLHVTHSCGPTRDPLQGSPSRETPPGDYKLNTSRGPASGPPSRDQFLGTKPGTTCGTHPGAPPGDPIYWIPLLDPLQEIHSRGTLAWDPLQGTP